MTPLSWTKDMRQATSRRPRQYARLARLAVTLGFVAAMLPATGCFVPIYSARPERRVQQLLFTSENMRAILEDYERFWLLDQPSHLTPVRTHGGLM